MDRPYFFRTLRKNKLPYRGGGGKKMQATTDCYRRIFCVWKFLWFLVCENQNIDIFKSNVCSGVRKTPQVVQWTIYIFTSDKKSG